MSSEPQLEFLFEMSGILEQPLQQIGETPHGSRMIGVVKEGSFEGPRLKGRLLAGGGDWALTRPDGVMELDVRVTLQTDDGALIYMTYRGYLAPRKVADEQTSQEEAAYFVVTPYFETSAAQYAWLQQVVTIGMGRGIPRGVGYRIYAVR